MSEGFLHGWIRGRIRRVKTFVRDGSEIVSISMRVPKSGGRGSIPVNCRILPHQDGWSRARRLAEGDLLLIEWDGIDTWVYHKDRNLDPLACLRIEVRSFHVLEQSSNYFQDEVEDQDPFVQESRWAS